MMKDLYEMYTQYLNSYKEAQKLHPAMEVLTEDKETELLKGAENYKNVAPMAITGFRICRCVRSWEDISILQELTGSPDITFAEWSEIEERFHYSLDIRVSANLILSGEISWVDEDEDEEYFLAEYDSTQITLDQFKKLMGLEGEKEVTIASTLPPFDSKRDVKAEKIEDRLVEMHFTADHTYLSACYANDAFRTY